MDIVQRNQTYLRSHSLPRRVRFCILFLFVLIFGFEVHAQNKKWKAWEVEADTLMNRDDFEKAIRLYSKIVSASKLKDESSFLILYKRSFCFYNENKFESALNDLNVFLIKYPDDSRARLLRAYVYKELGDDDMQMRDLSKVLEEQPSNPMILKWRAYLFIGKEEYASAKKDLTVARAIQDDTELEVYFGMVHYYSGNADSALMSLNTAIQLDSTDLTPYLYAGSYSLQEEEFEIALRYLDKASSIDPVNASVLFYKGIALVELKKEREGCSCLAKALAAGEDDAADYLKEYCYGVDD